MFRKTAVIAALGAITALSVLPALTGLSAAGADEAGAVSFPALPALVSGTAPTGAVAIAVGADPQAVVDASPAGTSFLISTGVHAGFSVAPNTGDTFYSQPGAVLDGRGVTPSAFRAFMNPGVAQHVTVVGASATSLLVIENYSNANGPQLGTIDAGNSTAWNLQWVEVTGSFSRGITTGNNMVVQADVVSNNGRLGIGGGGTNVVIAGCTLSGNAFHPVGMPYDEAGAIKAIGQGELIQNNTITANAWPGIWTDMDATNVYIVGNTITANKGEGVHIEISHYITVHNNQIFSNLQGGVKVSASDHIRISGNTIRDNMGGVLLGGFTRSSGARGLRILTHVRVVNNTVIDSLNTGVTGGALPTGQTVSFAGNSYVNTGFVYNGSLVSNTAWKASGHDVHGSSVGSPQHPVAPLT